MSTVKDVFVNQIGYGSNGSKFAYVRGAAQNEDFFLLDEEGKTVFSGKTGKAVKDRVAAEEICAADFSSFDKPGTYTVKIDGAQSVPFKIGDRLFDDLYLSILKYFYLSRCGQEIMLEEDSLWNHPACHTGIAKIYGTNKTKKVLGGWHDAGDYGRYIVAGSKTVMDLLLAYASLEASGTLATGEEKFDILNEVRFELEWMLEMQREDGAVYHKISCYHFCPFILPQEEKEALVIAPVSTSATADFAGCLAYASTFYKEKDKNFSEKLLSAAKKAQEYLDSHEDELYKNPPEITTGGYGDWSVKDERYFALCSLFAVTGEDEYLKKAMQVRKEAKAIPYNPEEPWKRPWIEGFGWGCVAGYGTEILLRNKKLIKDADIIEDLETSIKDTYEKVLERVKNASFGTSLEKVFWGSNGAVCDNAHLLLLAYDLTGNKEYFEAAKKQLDYILGCNPMNVCYVTGFGTNMVQNPHHRPSGAVGSTMPGMLSGGPSEWLADEIAKNNLQGKPPLQCFADIQGSYSTNEVAIYWNSPLVYLVARMAF
ncbi:MAG: glycoside hydrolase family 9 protein [Treponema sp.]|nr:glycoside hydrolase family 9 protein [Treponema sp.]